MQEKIIIRIEIFKEGKQYVSLCPELNVSSFGNSEEEAKASLIEAVSLFLEECRKMGTLEEVLKEAGFRYIKKPIHKWVSPRPVNIENLEVNFALA